MVPMGEEVRPAHYILTNLTLSSGVSPVRIRNFLIEIFILTILF